MATWNTAGRPVEPKTGTIGLNTDTNGLEVWSGTGWHAGQTNSAGTFAKDVLGSEAKPKVAKNSPLHMAIGSGLSTRVGLSQVATWNSLGRPKKPKTGMMGFNTATTSLEIWSGKVWHTVPMTLL